MKILKKKLYSSPRTEVICVQNEGILAGASITPQKNGGLQKTDYTPADTEHNGGETEW